MHDNREYEFIYGRQPVFEAVRGSRRVFEIIGTKLSLEWYFTKSKIFGLDLSFPVRETDKQSLHNILNRADSQGLAAKVELFQYTNLQIVIDRQPALILITDSITDPHNLGAMIRTANLCGVGAVIIPCKNNAQITPVVVHSSAGATEHIPIVKVDSIAHVVQMLKKYEYSTLATDKPGGNNIPLNKFKPMGKIALVMGSEGEGVHQKITHRCDTVISIPQVGILDSFNVSVATGIVLHYIALNTGLLGKDITPLPTTPHNR